MKKIISIVAGIILVIFSSYIILENFEMQSSKLENSKMNSQEILPPKYEITYTVDFGEDKVRLGTDKILFREFITKEDSLTKIRDNVAYITMTDVQLNPEFTELYEELGSDKNQKTVVVYPFFTAAAYITEPGFYDYYEGDCDAISAICLTIQLKEKYPLRFQTSGKAIQVLHLLGYDFISDVDIHVNPKILEKYDKVLLLHNEYVTQEMFNAITSHQKVIFLYPNALYGKIEFDDKSNTIQLIRGHGYPDGTDNGFDWEFENTRPYEFDTSCKNWEFYEITNGWMLNCYPENIFHKDVKFLEKIKEF